MLADTPAVRCLLGPSSGPGRQCHLVISPARLVFHRFLHSWLAPSFLVIDRQRTNSTGRERGVVFGLMPECTVISPRRRCAYSSRMGGSSTTHVHVDRLAGEPGRQQFPRHGFEIMDHATPTRVDDHGFQLCQRRSRLVRRGTVHSRQILHRSLGLPGRGVGVLEAQHQLVLLERKPGAR